MKAYVRFYDEDGARGRKATQVDRIPDRATVVQFSTAPDHYRMTMIDAASLRDSLNAASIRSMKSPEHACQFVVEQVGEFEYVVLCPSHPES